MLIFEKNNIDDEIVKFDINNNNKKFIKELRKSKS